MSTTFASSRFAFSFSLVFAATSCGGGTGSDGGITSTDGGSDDAGGAPDDANPALDDLTAGPLPDFFGVKLDFAGKKPDFSMNGPHDLAGGGGPDLTPPPPDMTGMKAGFTTVFTILLENHDYNEIVGSANAPYINSLIKDYGLATNYMDSLVHPSLPNYLYMISGSTQGVAADILPTKSPFPAKGDDLGSQLTAAGVPWRSYQESMGTPCKLVDAAPYAPKHNPFVYFSKLQADKATCMKVDVDYSQFDADLAAGTYRYMWITPNLTNDGHDGGVVPGLKNSDAWLKTEVAKILASTAYQSGGVLFVTWDEAEGRNGDSHDQIPMIVISPKLKKKGMTSNVAHDHASYLATVEDIFGLPRLGKAATATPLSEFFN